ncbi:CLUMA_CG004587, isoform A [Clunio marinus]|uniref:CLUMA_CG004587, isoform A n=1 Tax=Clunio marinus TaxID=568069 RepID=A0A1J1HTL3_9DIPT|nr:CLUMA_CG004587, isoform A [Clunio marinus]
MPEHESKLKKHAEVSWRPRSKAINVSIFHEYLMKTLDPNFKGVALNLMYNTIYINMRSNNTSFLKVLNEKLLPVYASWAYPKDSFLVESFNEKLEAFTENGLMEFLKLEYVDPKYLAVKEPKNGPKKLNLEELWGGFGLWMIGNIIAVIVVNWIGDPYRKMDRPTLVPIWACP